MYFVAKMRYKFRLFTIVHTIDIRECRLGVYDGGIIRMY